MSIYLVLDLLLILLIALFAPIGYWRGPVKELLVTFGILFGILLADFWARPWGRDLTDYTSIGASGGAFVVAMAFVILVTFILGYGAGSAIAPTDFRPGARLIGAGIALFNGMLLVSFSLQYVRVFLLSSSTEENLDDSYVVQFLMDQIGWVLLGAALLSWPLLLVILITGRRAYEPEEDYGDYDYAEVDEYGDDPYYDDDAPTVVFERPSPSAETRAFPPRVPTSTRDNPDQHYKTEPVPEPSLPTEATRPLRVSDNWQSPERTPAQDVDSEPVGGETDPDMAVIAPRTEEPSVDVTNSESDPGDEQPLAEGYSRCTNCRAVLPPDTRVCPVCGAVN